MIRTSRPLRIAAVTVFAVALTMTVAGPAAAAPGNEVVPVSPTDTPAQITSKAATVTPSSRQLAWQRKELTAFLHFGVNTFDDREVGDGTEDPNTFQPDALDTDQWVLALQNAGFK